MRGMAASIRVCNGVLHIGDRVKYDDGWLCFETTIINKEGTVGFYLENEFCDLLEFIREMTVFPESIPGAEMNFRIVT